MVVSPAVTGRSFQCPTTRRSRTNKPLVTTSSARSGEQPVGCLQPPGRTHSRTTLASTRPAPAGRPATPHPTRSRGPRDAGPAAAHAAPTPSSCNLAEVAALAPGPGQTPLDQGLTPAANITQEPAPEPIHRLTTTSPVGVPAWRHLLWTSRLWRDRTPCSQQRLIGGWV